MTVDVLQQIARGETQLVGVYKNEEECQLSNEKVRRWLNTRKMHIPYALTFNPEILVSGSRFSGEVSAIYFVNQYLKDSHFEKRVLETLTKCQFDIECMKIETYQLSF